MGSIHGPLDHPLARATDDHIAYVAVGKYFRESKLNLLWALQNCGRRRICILHVHRPEQRISVLGGKLPISSLDDKKVKEHQKIERKAMQDTLGKYLSICGQRMQVQKLFIEMDSIEQGIVELLHQHGIKHLVMGAAADRHYSKEANTNTDVAPLSPLLRSPTFPMERNLVRRIQKNREGSTGVSICDPWCSLTRQTDIPSSSGYPKEQNNDDIESDLFSLPLNHSIISSSDQEIMINPTLMPRTLPSLSATEASANPETGLLNHQRSLIFPLVHKYGDDRERGFSNSPFPIDHPSSSGSSASFSTTGADITREYSSKEKNTNVRLESDLFSLSLDDSGRSSAVDFASPSQKQRLSRSSLNTDEGSIEEQEFGEALAKERPEEHEKVKTERDQLTEALRLCQEQKMSLQRQNVELQRQRDQLQIERNHALKQVERMRKKQERRALNGSSDALLNGLLLLAVWVLFLLLLFTQTFLVVSWFYPYLYIKKE